MAPRIRRSVLVCSTCLRLTMFGFDSTFMAYNLSLATLRTSVTFPKLPFPMTRMSSKSLSPILGVMAWMAFMSGVDDGKSANFDSAAIDSGKILLNGRGGKLASSVKKRR